MSQLTFIICSLGALLRFEGLLSSTALLDSSSGVEGEVEDEDDDDEIVGGDNEGMRGGSSYNQ